MPASYATHRSQLELILRAWGMPEATAINTAEIMSWADLHGIDTHGISMVPPYDERRRAGRIDMRAQPTVARETPVSALIDGGGGLGHANARRAMELAIDKAKATGIGVAAVRNSAHFGACGFYALMAVEAGLIGMVTTSASGIQVAPTYGAQARFGTDPIAFAAPGRPGEPFLLDMATTTVAAGKIRNKANENLPTPPGWLVTAEGKPSTDPREVSKGGFMTPLGGTPEGSSHKGYGLSAMVNILSAALSGASMITDPLHTKRPGTMGIGHFLLALDPGLFRDAADFRAEKHPSDTQKSAQKLREAAETIQSQNVSLEQANKLLRERSTAAMESLSATVDARDSYTAGHSRRVQQLSLAIGRELGLSQAELDLLGHAALFHDIGKLAIPDAILLKPASLTGEEWALMQRHAEEGARIIDRLGFLQDAVPAIRHHHERFDGTGYPDRIAGEEIPLGARIIHVADALDSMLTTRIYRAARPVNEALAEVKDKSATQFCPRCVAALERILPLDSVVGDIPSVESRAHPQLVRAS